MYNTNNRIKSTKSNSGHSSPGATEHSVDYAIIGAGIAGLTMACSLSDRMPAASVLVLERSRVAGSGTSGRASGWVRSIFGDEHLVQLATRSQDLFRGYARSGNTPFQIRKRPAVLAFDDHEQLERLAGWCQKAGRPGVELDQAELSRRCPEWRLSAAEHALWFDDEVQINPLAALDYYWFAAHYNKVKFEFRTEVTALEELEKGWKLVTTRGVFRARTLIMTAGHWSQEFTQRFPPLRKMHGILKTAVTTMATHEGTTQDTSRDTTPFYAQFESGLTVIPTSTSGQLILTHRIDPADERLKNEKGVDSIDPWELPRDLGLLPDDVLNAAVDLIPALSTARVERIWSGVIACTPTGYPMAGKVSDAHQPPAWLLGGLSGSGFALAPSIAELIADQLAGKDVPAWFSKLDPASGHHNPDNETEQSEKTPHNYQLLF